MFFVDDKSFERYAGSYDLLLCFFSYLRLKAFFSEDSLKTLILLIFQDNTNRHLEGCNFETVEKSSMLISFSLYKIKFSFEQYAGSYILLL